MVICQSRIVFFSFSLWLWLQIFCSQGVAIHVQEKKHLHIQKRIFFFFRTQGGESKFMLLSGPSFAKAPIVDL
jgi:hypothetical protein